MVPMAYVAHQIPGRIRLRVPDRRGDNRYFESVRKTLSEHPAVERLRASPVSASIVIHHQGAATPITAAASQRGLFEIAPAPSASQAAPRKEARAASGSPFDPVATGLAGLALLQASRGQVFGSAAENFWNAHGARRILQRPGLAAFFAVVGAYQVFRGRYFGPAASLYFYSLAIRQVAKSETAGGNLVRGRSRKTSELGAE
jgi:hypothetical protein